jgi:hypothetical protein
MILGDEGGRIAINPDKFDKLITIFAPDRLKNRLLLQGMTFQQLKHPIR